MVDNKIITNNAFHTNTGWTQGLSQEMIKESPMANLLIVRTGSGLGSSHNAIWWNLAIFFLGLDWKYAVQHTAGRVSG